MGNKNKEMKPNKDLCALLDSYIDEDNFSYSLFNKLSDKLNALEIIKEKGINVAFLKRCIEDTYFEYKDSPYYTEDILEENEFNLLKEVLK